LGLITNVVNNKELKIKMGETLKFLSDVLSKTLGPYGATTIIQDRFYNHTITKDGYNVIKQIKIEEDVPATILDFVKKISRGLVRKVGDGSTSSIIVAYSLYNSLVGKNGILKKYNIPTSVLFEILNKLTKCIEQKIRERSLPIDNDLSKLIDIATIATNNNKELGNLVKDIFKEVGKYGFINIEHSKTSKTYYEVTRGIEIPRGYINQYMATEADKRTATYLNPYIFMCDSIMTENQLENIADLIGFSCLSLGRPLVFVAKGYDHAIHTFFQVNLAKKRDLPVIAIDIATDNKHSMDTFIDLSIALGCTPWLKNNGEPFPKKEDFKKILGECNKIISTEYATKFIEGLGDPTIIENRINFIEGQMTEYTRLEIMNEMDERLFQYKKRLASLRNSMAILYIGGNTEEAKETNKHLLEDAVSACRSAIEHGYVIGGNLIIPIILNDGDTYFEIFDKLLRIRDDTSLIVDIIGTVNNAFIKSFLHVLDNKEVKEENANIITNCIKDSKIYNLKTEQYEKINDTGIINSAETDIEILQSAISIIGLLATSNQFVGINFTRNPFSKKNY